MNGIYKTLLFIIVLHPRCLGSSMSTNIAAGQTVSNCGNEEKNTFLLPGCHCSSLGTQVLPKTNLDIEFIEKNCNYTSTMKEMKIASNFKTIDPKLFLKLSHIEKLVVTYLNFTKINVTTYNLTFVDFSHNKLKTFYVEIMENLLYLNISYNALKWFKMNTREKNLTLEILDISFNNMSKLDSNLTVPSLKYLNLSHNFIENISPEYFRNYPNLVDLNLSHNKIRFLKLDSFHRLSGLKSLYISSNNLNSVDVVVFNAVNKLEKLDLSSNNVSSFEFDDMLEILSNLRVLKIRNNPLDCDRLEEIENNFKLSGKVLISNEKCPSEGNYKGHCCIFGSKSTLKDTTNSHIQITVNKKPMTHFIATEHPIIRHNRPDYAKKDENSLKNVSAPERSPHHIKSKNQLSDYSKNNKSSIEHSKESLHHDILEKTQKTQSDNNEKTENFLENFTTNPAPSQVKNQPNDNGKKNVSSLKIFMEKLHHQNSENVKNFLNITMTNIDSKMDDINCRFEQILVYLKCIVVLIIILMVPIFIKLAITVKDRFYSGKKNKKDFLPLMTYQN